MFYRMKWVDTVSVTLHKTVRLYGFLLIWICLEIKKKMRTFSHRHLPFNHQGPSTCKNKGSWCVQLAREFRQYFLKVLNPRHASISLHKSMNRWSNKIENLLDQLSTLFLSKKEMFYFVSEMDLSEWYFFTVHSKRLQNLPQCCIQTGSPSGNHGPP